MVFLRLRLPRDYRRVLAMGLGTKTKPMQATIRFMVRVCRTPLQIQTRSSPGASRQVGGKIVLSLAIVQWIAISGRDSSAAPRPAPNSG